MVYILARYHRLWDSVCVYHLTYPDPLLQRYIENYWFVSHDPDEEVTLHVEVFVDARPDLIFNFEAPYVREVVRSESREINESNVDLQRLVPIRIRQRGLMRLAGVRFRLGGLAPFTLVNLHQWSGLTPPPSRILGPGANALEDDLRAENDIAVCTSLLDDYFLRHLRLSPAHVAFDRALASLVASEGMSTSYEISVAVSISPRQVQRLFARHLGFAPRTVARVIRFQKAVRRLMVEPGVSLGEVAADAHYYDHAHFIRDFREFTGGVPRGYRGYYPPECPDDFAPNVVAYVQDAVWPGQPD